MKTFNFFVLLIFVSQILMAQGNKGPIIKFDNESYNFKEIINGAVCLFSNHSIYKG